MVLETDQNTFSSYKSAKIEEYEIEVELNFDEEKISGEAQYKITALEDLKVIYFDNWFSLVPVDEGIMFSCMIPPEKTPQVPPTEVSNWIDRTEANPTQGGYIEIPLDGLVQKYIPDEDKLEPDDKIPKGITFFLTIKYETYTGWETQGDFPRGYNFLKKEQTHSKKYPFFYTQNMPIYGRTWFPSFDTPMSQSLFQMTITVPKELQVYSSSVTSSRDEDGDKAIYIFDFEQVPVSTSQIALVAGNFQVYTFPDNEYIQILCEDGEILEMVSEEMKEFPKWLEAAEEAIGIELHQLDYTKFNLVFMPPNYPYQGDQYGGLTYLSPSIAKSGKRKGISEVSQQIASMYFGVRASCSNWQNMWLNTGLATYLQRNMGDIIEGEYYELLDRIDGNFTLTKTMNYIYEYQLDTSFLSLHPQTKEQDPYNSFTAVSFEKGYQFMAYFEQLIGEVHMKNMLGQWVTYLHQRVPSVGDYELFKWFSNEYMEKYVNDGEEIAKQIDWDKWINGIGYPPEGSLNPFESTEYDEVYYLADRFLQFSGSAIPENWKILKEYWNEDQKCVFLELINQNEYLVGQRLIKQLSHAYRFSEYQDPEVLSRWFKLIAIHRLFTPREEQRMRDFLGSTGRTDLLFPVYEGLVKGGNTKKAEQIFEMQQEFYNPVTKREIKKLFDVQCK